VDKFKIAQKQNWYCLCCKII